jgi:hypothetical protein
MSLHAHASATVLPAMLGRTCVRTPRSRATRNTGYHWTPGEIRLLQRLATDGTSPRVIARQLGRTESSVVRKARRQGIAFEGR